MTRVYRALLRLYPSTFRREYGDEMVEIFAQRTANAGPLGRVAMLASAVVEIVGNASLVHLDLLRQDLAYTARTLRRSPLFAVTAVLVTALGVGANTAAFSVADFVLFQPLPYRDAESLVRLCAGPRREPAGWGCNNLLSPASYRELEQQTTSFDGLGAFQRSDINLVGGGDPQHLRMAKVTAEVFPLLGVPAELGSALNAGSASEVGTRGVVLSHGLWESRFGSDRNVLGRSVNLDGVPYVVTGVMPTTFHFPGREYQLWTALELKEEDYLDRQNNYLEAVGRLGTNVTFEEARAELEVALDRLESGVDPEFYSENGVSFFKLRDEYAPRFRLMLQALAGASLCILVLACANLANLLLVRAGARERELAVRAALGAGSDRLVRQMITESLVLAVLGGAAGVLVSVLALPLLSLMIPSSLPIASEPRLDLRMLGVAGLFTALTGLGFGLAPALRAGGRGGLNALRTGARSSGGRRRGYRSVLVAVEVASSVVLLATSGLLIRAVLRVQATEPGFQAEGVLAMRTMLPKPEYVTAARRDEFYGPVLQRIRALPGVESAAFTSGLPMVLTGGIARVVVPGEEVRPDGDYSVSRRYITPQFFTTMGIPLLMGRDLEDGDTGEAAYVSVVSQSFARRYWPNGVAIGRAFEFQARQYTVVGVVGDVMVRGLERISEPQMYLPTSRAPESLISAHDPKDLVIRTSGLPMSLLPAVREIVRSVDPSQPISDVRTLSDLLADQTAPRRAQVRVLTALAAVALLLAGLGLHGLLAYSVAQRRREIGVRLALGEHPTRIARRVVWDGVHLVVIGLLPGLVAAYAAGRYMASMLFGIAPSDPVTLAATIAVCLFVGLIGSALPAIRAVRVSPLTAIRAE